MKGKILYFIFSTIFLISCSSKISYEEQINQYNQLVSTADLLIKDKNYKQAVEVSSQAIKITDTLSYAFIKRGNAFFGLKEFNDAVNDFSDVIKIEGEKSFAYKERAMANFFNNKKKKFLNDINHYIKYHKNDFNAYSLRADFFIEKEDYEKAISDYTFCLNSDPKNSSFYLKRGNIYALNGQSNLSILDYESYTRLNPNENNDQIYYKRALLNMKVNNFQKAIDDFSLISGSNTDSKIFELKGDCYYELNDYSNAIKSYSVYIEKEPNDYETINKRGNAYLNLKNFQKSNADFKNVASLKWKSNGFFYKYGWFILFIIGFFLVGVIIKKFFKEEYDNRQIMKSYLYFFFTGLFGGHYLYLGNVFRYSLYSVLVFLILLINRFYIRSFYNHHDLLWSGIFSSKISSWTIYIILILFVIDLIFLSYFTFSKNHALRASINEVVSKNREIEINKLNSLLERQNTKFKKLQS